MKLKNQKHSSLIVSSREQAVTPYLRRIVKIIEVVGVVVVGLTVGVNVSPVVVGVLLVGLAVGKPVANAANQSKQGTGRVPWKFWAKQGLI